MPEQNRLILVLTFIGIIFSKFSEGQIVNFGPSEETYFPIVHNTTSATIYYSQNDAEVVKISAKLFAEDIERVTGILPAIDSSENIISEYAIIAGSIENSSLIKSLSGKGVF